MYYLFNQNMASNVTLIIITKYRHKASVTVNVHVIVYNT